MTTLREAAQQALEALTNCNSEHGHRCNRCDSEVDEGGKVAAALRAALAQQEEPVWMHPWPPVRAQQAEPVKPVATLTAQRDALLEALKDATKTIEHLGYPLAAIERARAAIKAVEETK